MTSTPVFSYVKTFSFGLAQNKKIPLLSSHPNDLPAPLPQTLASAVAASIAGHLVPAPLAALPPPSLHRLCFVLTPTSESIRSSLYRLRGNARHSLVCTGTDTEAADSRNTVAKDLEERNLLQAH